MIYAKPGIPVYLECQSRSEEAATNGAAEALSRISREWFGFPDLAIEQKYEHLIIPA